MFASIYSPVGACWSCACWSCDGVLFFFLFCMLWFSCLCVCCNPFNVYSLFYSIPLFSMLEYDTENMNSDEIFSSLRGVTEAIQSFSYRSQEDLNEPIRRDGKKDDAVSICF